MLADEQVTSLSTGGNTVWALADHLGSIRDIADLNEGNGSTSVVNHRRYNAFGKRIIQTGAVDVIFGYTGKRFDEATGLQNNLNRWYDPNLGKWISQDPIGFAAGDANLYRYVGNSPPNATDPSGLETWWQSLFGLGLGDPYMQQYGSVYAPEIIRSPIAGGFQTTLEPGDAERISKQIEYTVALLAYAAAETQNQWGPGPGRPGIRLGNSIEPGRPNTPSRPGGLGPGNMAPAPVRPLGGRGPISGRPFDAANAGGSDS